MDTQATLSTIVSLLRGMYACSNNHDRRQLTISLLSLEDRLDGAALTSVGVSLLGLTAEGAAVQAYGAVLLKNALRGRKVTVEQLPLWDLLTWYCNEPGMSELLCEDLRKLLVECAYSASTNIVPRILETLLSQQHDLSGLPRHLLLLQSLVAACLEPDFDRVDRAKVGALRKSVVASSERLLRTMTNTLFSLYSSATGATNAAALPSGMEGSLEAACSVVALVAPVAPFQLLVDVGLGETLAALLRWQPSQRLAAMASTAVLRTADNGSAERQKLFQSILVVVLECLPSCVNARDIGLVDEILMLLKEIPRALVSSASSAICQCLVGILTIPSIWFGEQVCSVLLSLNDAEGTPQDSGTGPLQEINALDLYGHLRSLVVKHRCDPDSGSDAEGVALSQEQLGFTQLYRQTFDSFRSLSGRLIRVLARLRPRESNYYTLQLFSELSDAAGTAADERTSGGYVTQRSATFLQWEATSFMVEHLTEAFRFSADYVPECIAALQRRQPADAVLTPLYLNMLSCFWRCPDPTRSLNVWVGTLEILFRFLTASADSKNKSTAQQDLDEEAAHRRAHTLLVTACSEHASEMGHDVVVSCMQQVKAILFTAKGQDRALLYECVAALVQSMGTAEAAGEFASLVDPVLAVTRETALPLTQPQFNDIFLGTTRELREVRETLRTSIDILSAVFRRSQPAPHVMERLNALIPVMTHLVALLHGVVPSDLPPAFRDLLELSESEREQYLPGRSRRSDVAERKSPAYMARLTFLHFRTALYQLVGAVCPLIPTEHLSTLLQSMLQQRTESVIPINHIRTLTQKCLFPVGENHPLLLCPVLSLVTSFFAQHTAYLAQAQEQNRQQQQRQPNGREDGARGDQGRRSGEEDVVTDKLWFYYTKDVLNYARARVVENGQWRTTPGLLEAATTLAVSVLESGCDGRNAHHFTMTLMDMKAVDDVGANAVASGTNTVAGLPDILLESQRRLYVVLLRSALLQVQRSVRQRGGARSGELPKDIDSTVYGVTGPYIRLIPSLSCCLEMIGIPADEVQKLHAHLIMCNSDSAKRRKVKDLLVAFASAT